MNDSFRDRLVKLESATPALKVRYDKEIQAMLEKQVSGIRRWAWLGAAVVGAVTAAIFAVSAIHPPVPLPPMARLGFAAGALFGIGWAILGWRVFRRGTIHLKTDAAAVARMSWMWVLVLAVVLMIAAPDSLAGLRAILMGLMFLIVGLVIVLRHVIEQSELKTREKLLELEYRFAELAETMRRDPPKP